jgi:hypothetical protein
VGKATGKKERRIKMEILFKFTLAFLAILALGEFVCEDLPEICPQVKRIWERLYIMMRDGREYEE